MLLVTAIVNCHDLFIVMSPQKIYRFNLIILVSMLNTIVESQLKTKINKSQKSLHFQ